MWHWFAHWLGLDSVSDAPYAFWSGSGGILVIWAASVLLIWQRTSCRAAWWCPLHGAHEFTDPLDGVSRRLCWVHHPDVKSRHLSRARLAEIQQRREQWQQRRHLYVGRKPGRG